MNREEWNKKWKSHVRNHLNNLDNNFKTLLDENFNDCVDYLKEMEFTEMFWVHKLRPPEESDELNIDEFAVNFQVEIDGQAKPGFIGGVKKNEVFFDGFSAIFGEEQSKKLMHDVFNSFPVIDMLNELDCSKEHYVRLSKQKQ